MNRKVKALNALNNELDHQINEENQEAFTNMICYLRASNISEYDQEMVRHDLSEMILSAQARGENIHSVIGEDYQTFCDHVIASLPAKTTKQKLIDCFDLFCWCLSIIGTINIITSAQTISLIRNLIIGKPLDFNISISVGMIASAGITMVAAGIITQVILKTSFQTKTANKHSKIKSFLIGCGIMSGFLLIAWLGKGTLFTINLFAACGCVVFLYAAHKVLESYQQ